MARVNLTCATCAADDPCASCRAIAKALRSAGHSSTQTSRYDALRAAAVGTYGFEACILPVGRHEHAVLDAATNLFNRTRVALVTEPGAAPQMTIADNFAVIETADWRQQPFPTDWLTALHPTDSHRDTDAGSDETRSFVGVAMPAEDFVSARRRLKSIAARAQLGIGAAGFTDAPRLDLLALLEDEIAWAKMSGGCFGLVLIIAPDKPDSSQDAELALAFVKDRIAGAVRTTDSISQGRDSLLVILAEAALDQTTFVAGRIRKAARKAIKDAARDESLAPALRHVRVGTSVYPTHGTTRAALLARATASAESVM